jgi:hypothetical protein
MSSSETQTGVQIDKGTGPRNFSDSKPKILLAGSPLTSCIKDARTDKKRKATVLTVDNADDVLRECFPFTSASKRHLDLLGIDIVGDLEIDPDRVKALDLQAPRFFTK